MLSDSHVITQWNKAYKNSAKEEWNDVGEGEKLSSNRRLAVIG